MARPLLVSRNWGGILHMSDQENIYLAIGNLAEIKRMLMFANAHHEALLEAETDLGIGHHSRSLAANLSSIEYHATRALHYLHKEVGEDE